MEGWLDNITDLRARDVPFCLVTVVRGTGSTPRDAGAKMVVLEDSFFGTIGGGRLESLALEEARACLLSGESRVSSYPLGAKSGQCCGGVVELLFEAVQAGPRLYLFGAGHVGQALCRVLAGTSFRIHLIDDREEWLGAAGIPTTVVRHREEWDDFVAKAEWSGARSYALIMTHQHDRDQEILAALLRRPFRYLGLIGSRPKWRRFRDRLLLRGFDDGDLSRVRCPIGLPIGGKSPQEVAISAAAELVSVHHAGNKRDITRDPRGRTLVAHGSPQGAYSLPGPPLDPGADRAGVTSGGGEHRRGAGP